MKTRTLIIICVIIGTAAGLFFVFSNRAEAPAIQEETMQTSSETPAPDNNSIVKETAGDAGANSQANIGQSQNKLVTDDFEVTLPDGWERTTPIMGSSAMAVNRNEKLDDPAAQKINFRSYLAVSYDTFQGERKDMSEYLQTVKDGLLQAIPSTVFSNEQDTVINGRPARAMEMELTKQGVNYKILVVAVAGQEEDVWVMSFNTTKNSWDGYKEIFSNIAKSFSLKK